MREDTVWLAYRVPRPGNARGYANVLARSEDGVHFETVVELAKERFGAMSLERPALVVTPGGRWRGTVLRGRAGAWDARGVRMTAVALHDRTAIALYDGRATAEENWEERTGAAIATIDRSPEGERVVGSFVARGGRPVAQSPHGQGGLRYVAAVDLPGGARRLYYEADCGGGSHEIRTERVAHVEG